jgi:hypothetical protein
MAAADVGVVAGLSPLCEFSLLTQAFDGDEPVAGGGTVRHRYRPRDLVPTDLAEGGRAEKVAGLAVGSRNRNSATCPGRQAAVHTIAIGIVRNDEDTLLRLRRGAEKHSRKAKRAQYGPHRSPPQSTAEDQRNADNAGAKLKAFLTTLPRPRAMTNAVLAGFGSHWLEHERHTALQFHGVKSP